MEACYGGTDVMERSCAVARGIEINISQAIKRVGKCKCPCICSFKGTRTWNLPLYERAVAVPPVKCKTIYHRLCTVLYFILQHSTLYVFFAVYVFSSCSTVLQQHRARHHPAYSNTLARSP
jgi:hypothetical protein